MTYEVAPIYHAGHRMNGLRVRRAEGSTWPSLECEGASIVDALIIRNVLNAIHPDVLDKAMKDALAESSAHIDAMEREMKEAAE